MDGKTKKRSDSTWETLTNGEVIEYHPSFCFGSKLQLFPKELRTELYQQRKEYKEGHNKRGKGGCDSSSGMSKNA